MTLKNTVNKMITINSLLRRMSTIRGRKGAKEAFATVNAPTPQPLRLMRRTTIDYRKLMFGEET